MIEGASFGNGHMRPVAELDNRGGFVRFHVGTRGEDRTNFRSGIRRFDRLGDLSAFSEGWMSLNPWISAKISK